jgi:hypothetical protein
VTVGVRVCVGVRVTVGVAVRVGVAVPQSTVSLVDDCTTTAGPTGGVNVPVAVLLIGVPVATLAFTLTRKEMLARLFGAIGERVPDHSMRLRPAL